jgi:hypothetical protein
VVAPSRELEAAIEATFEAVNGYGRQDMTDADDAYVSTWFTTVEALAATSTYDPDRLRQLMLADRLPLPSYIRSDGAQMVPRDLLSLIARAGGEDTLPAWFAAHWRNPVEAVDEWDAYLRGHYVCLRVVSPENMKRKGELVHAIEQMLSAVDSTDEWLRRLHELVDELDALEPPFAPFDRRRFGGPVSRDRLIDDVRRDHPHKANSSTSS